MWGALPPKAPLNQALCLWAWRDLYKRITS